MRFSTASTAAVLAFCTAQVSAHTRVFGLSVNGEDQGDGRGVYIRSPPNNDPVKDLTSPNMACNVNGATPVASFVTAAAGDTLTFEWYHDNRGDDIVAASHKGPIITYVAEYTEGDVAGPIWTKIHEAGYDATTSKWAVDTLIAAKGKIDVVVPSSLAAGRYLFRQEIIALHESDRPYNDGSGRGAQFYPSCAQVEVTGSGTAVPDENFDFNTGYTTADPGIVFNLYGSFTSYDIPGPAVWSGASSGAPATGGSGPAAPSVAVPTSTAAATPTAAAPTTTNAAATPTATPPPSTGCGARRRRRSQRKH